MKLTALREIPQNKVFQKGDVFILFGELFGKGYVNGLIQQAKAHQMEIIGITVGRRDDSRNLRALTKEELQESEKMLGGKIINIPLEAGFDLEQVDDRSPVDLVNEVNKSDWKSAKLDKQHILKCKKQAEQKFIQKVEKVVDILYQKISPQKNIFFAHTMAGGFVRSKLLFLIANKVFKGKGLRHESSKDFWQSEIGRLCSESFDSVTADTFYLLVTLTEKIRKRNETHGKCVFYSSYGYHGTEILIKNKLSWQTYIPYQQGDAKKKLENYSREFRKKNIATVVFNCPEILTNSSSVFLGVELSLIALIWILEKYHPSTVWVRKIYNDCQELLQEGTSLQSVLELLQERISSPTLRKYFVFEDWPIENSREISDLIIGTSEEVRSMHKNQAYLISDYLSKLVIEATGYLIFNYASDPKESVLWLGHDIIAKKLFEIYGEK